MSPHLQDVETMPGLYIVTIDPSGKKRTRSSEYCDRMSISLYVEKRELISSLKYFIFFVNVPTRRSK